MVKIEDLEQINIFKGVPRNLLGGICQEAHLNIYSEGTQLFSAGDVLDTFYMMVMGQVALQVELSPDVDAILDLLQSGRSFGLSALLKGSACACDAICQEPCEVITLQGSRMLAMFETHPKLGYYVMAGVAGQYKRNLDMRAQMILKTLDLHPGLKQKMQNLEQQNLERLIPVF